MSSFEKMFSLQLAVGICSVSCLFLSLLPLYTGPSFIIISCICVCVCVCAGVYQYTTGSALGGHAIKILGWGTESGTPYWLVGILLYSHMIDEFTVNFFCIDHYCLYRLVANSWNKSWGDNGE